MSAFSRLCVPYNHCDSMIRHALAELPNECCGLLAGNVSDGAAAVTSCIPLDNELSSPTEYNASARSLLQAHKEMRRCELELLAIYHSHPTSLPIPSKTDLARCYDTEVVYFIVSLVDVPHVKGWRLTNESYHSAEWVVVRSSALANTCARLG